MIAIDVAAEAGVAWHVPAAFNRRAAGEPSSTDDFTKSVKVFSLGYWVFVWLVMPSELSMMHSLTTPPEILSCAYKRRQGLIELQFFFETSDADKSTCLYAT